MSLAGENADWSYAQKEAVVARLNGKDVNLDQLTNQDLANLYSSILKVRHSRTASSVASGDRPESRMSFMDGISEAGDDEEDEEDETRSRPFSGSTWTTDPTSLADSTLTLSNLPELEVHGNGFNDLPTGHSPASAAASISSAAAEAAEKEKRVMEDKVKKLEAQMAAQRKRIAKLRSTGTAGGGEDAVAAAAHDELEELLERWPKLTAEQEPIARDVLARWRRRRRIRMAEDALSQAVVLKEANVLSRELKKGVSFQFVVIQRDVPASASEQIPGLGDIEEVSDPHLASIPKPTVGVKVLDRRNQIVSIWSLAKLRHRLEQMRNAHKWVDKPEYAQHFSSEDPFYESPSPPGGFSYVGNALVSLVPLSRNKAASYTAQIYSLYIADPIGSAVVKVKPVEVRPPPPTSGENGSGNGALDGEEVVLQVGGTLVVDVEVGSVSGLEKSEFAALHIQLSSSTFFGVPPSQDKFVTSEIAQLGGSSAVYAKLEQRFEIPLTASVLQHLTSSYSDVSFFARTRLPHFDKIERWDEARDGAVSSKVPGTPSIRNDPMLDDVTRRPEAEFIMEQQHDVLASVEIRELGEQGEYARVPVVSTNSLDAGAFFLRQGLQRRFVLNLAHNSGRAFAWRRVSKVSLGNVRMLDSRGREHAATSVAAAELRGMGKPRPQFAADGTATLSFAASWDSGVHDSPHLNRTTPSGSRALLALSFDIDVAGCAAPISFIMDVAVTISPRDARPPSKLFSLLSSTRLSSRISNVFSVRLRPSKSRKAGDLWRLDTAETYVRGEEQLAGWKPRGLNLVRDYDASSAAKRKAADVEATKALLEAYDLTLPTVEDLPREDRLRGVIGLWEKQFGSREEVRCLLLSLPSLDADLCSCRSRSTAINPFLRCSTSPLPPRHRTWADLLPLLLNSPVPLPWSPERASPLPPLLSTRTDLLLFAAKRTTSVDPSPSSATLPATSGRSNGLSFGGRIFTSTTRRTSSRRLRSSTSRLFGSSSRRRLSRCSRCVSHRPFLLHFHADASLISTCSASSPLPSSPTKTGSSLLLTLSVVRIDLLLLHSYFFAAPTLRDMLDWIKGAFPSPSLSFFDANSPLSQPSTLPSPKHHSSFRKPSNAPPVFPISHLSYSPRPPSPFIPFLGSVAFRRRRFVPSLPSPIHPCAVGIPSFLRTASYALSSHSHCGPRREMGGKRGRT